MADEERMADRSEDDVEGQKLKKHPAIDGTAGADDVEGAKRRLATEEEAEPQDDVEGHKRR